MSPMQWLMETRIENQVVPSRQAGTMEKGAHHKVEGSVLREMALRLFLGREEQTRKKLQSGPLSGALPQP